MRTSPIGALAALIAVLALVAAAGPAQTRTPGTAVGSSPGSFTPLVLDPPPAVAATVTAPAGATRPSVDLGAGVLADPGAVLVPTRAPIRDLPAARVKTLVKPAAPPAAQARGVVTRGGAGWRSAAYSWYGPGLYGNGTACGRTLTRSLVGVAHRSLPCGTRVTFRNPANGRSITVRVVDRGPYVSGRTWDLTSAACNAIGACHTGTIQWRLP